jgi:hypothetical protein
MTDTGERFSAKAVCADGGQVLESADLGRREPLASTYPYRRWLTSSEAKGRLKHAVPMRRKRTYRFSPESAAI